MISKHKNILPLILAFFMLLSPLIFAGNSMDCLQHCQAFIDQKKFDEAISYADIKITVFEEDNDVNSLLEMLNLKAKAYIHQYKFDEGMAIYIRVEALAKKHHKTEKYANALASQGSLLIYQSKYDKALILNQKILQLQGLDSTITSDAHTQLGSIYYYKENLDSSVYHHQKAVTIDKALNDHSSLPFSLAALAKTYEARGKLEQALKLYIQGMSYLRPEKDDYKMASFNNMIAQIFLKLNNYPKAEEYIDKSIEIATKKNIVLTLSYSQFVKANILQHSRKEKEAQYLLEEILQVFLDKNRKDHVVACYARLGSIAINQNRIDDADSLIHQGEIVFEKLNNNQLIHELVFAQVKLAQSKKLFFKAEKKLQLLENEKAYENNPRFKLRYLAALISLKTDEGKLAEAINLIHLKNEFNQEVEVKNQAYLITEMEAKYHKMEDAKKIEKLHSENQIKSLLVRKKNDQLYGSIFLLILSLIASAFIIKQNKKIKKMVLELEVKNQKINLALQEKEILLKEIHHRVKNNLQIVSSLLNMQSRDVEEQTAKDALNESKNRVHSMAMIHQELYQLKNIVGINSKNYIEKLTKNLLRSYRTEGGDITLVNDIDDINLDVDTSIPLGLIINELITNSLKYAFPDNMDGKIELTLRRHAEYLQLTISDNGIGMDNSINSSANAFGLKMVRIFAQKLNAEWEIIKKNGTTVSLKIKNFKTA